MNSQDFFKKKLPDTAGVYFFLGRNKKVLYIGKATSLRDRVRSYFTKDIVEVRSPLIKRMVDEARAVEVRATDSVLEALLLEADLIKKFQPKYNTDEKDDKSFNCVVITREDFPRIIVVRKKEIDFSSLQTTNYELQTIFGPFPNGAQLRDALKIVRRIFPYRDNKCTPAYPIPPFLKEVPSPRGGGFKSLPHKNAVLPLGKGEFKNMGKPCFNRQIGLCPGVCTGEISKTEYAKTVRNIKLFFSGKKGQILKNLKRDMKDAAQAHEFERAGEIKKTIFALEHIQDVALLVRENTTPHSPPSTEGGRGGWGGFRIEAYDVAHISGTDAVGAMVVLENGVPKKSDYRKFNIRGGFGNNDVASLKEVIERRLNHREWPLPNLFVADGGEAQKKVIEDALKVHGLSTPVVAVTKNERHRPEKLLGDATFVRIHERAILLANAEAHRFALSFHRRRRSRHYNSQTNRG